MEAGLPAPVHSGGCGACIGGGSTTTFLKRQKRPSCENRSRVVHAFRIISSASSKRLRLLGRDTEAFEFGMAVAFSDPEIEPSTGHEVEGCGLLGEQNWVVPGQHQHGGAKAERRRARGEPSQKLQRRGDLVPAREVVLDEKGGAIAKRFRLHVELDKLVEPLAQGGAGPLAVRLRAAENCELHQRVLGLTPTALLLAAGADGFSPAAPRSIVIGPAEPDYPRSPTPWS